ILGGSIVAHDIYLAGMVCNDTVIKAKSLEVKLGADQGGLQVAFGSCKLEIGDAPEKKEVIASRASIPVSASASAPRSASSEPPHKTPSEPPRAAASGDDHQPKQKR